MDLTVTPTLPPEIGIFILFGTLAISAIVGLVGIVLWIYLIIDAIKRKETDTFSSNEKIVWILVMLFTSAWGPLLYYFLVYRKYGKAI